MFVCHFVSTSPQGSSWVQHMSILLFIITGAFSTNEKVWTLSDFTRVLSRRIKWTVKHAFKRRCFLLLQFKDFFLPGSTISIPNISKWCFSQFKFWFAYERFLPFSRIWTSWSSHHSITLRSFQLWKIRLFLRLFTLKSQLFSFAANCMALMSMTAKSPDNEQINPFVRNFLGRQRPLKILPSKNLFLGINLDSMMSKIDLDCFGIH